MRLQARVAHLDRSLAVADGLAAAPRRSAVASQFARVQAAFAR
jgi:hypothetical protein